MIYTVKLTEVLERRITCTVEAEDEQEARQKAYDCEWIDSDEDMVEDQIMEVKNIRVMRDLE
jgi:hypothetical protein